MAFFNQATGITAINMFSTDIFETMAANGSSITATTGTQILGAGSLIGVFLAPVNMRFLNRRQVFIGGQIAMGLCTFCVGLFNILELYTGVVVFMFLFLMCFQSTMASAMFVYCAEVLTDASMGFVLASLSAFSFAESLAVNPMINSGIGTAGTFWIFSALTLSGAVLFFFTLKETKGITKEHQKRLWFPQFEARTSIASKKSTMKTKRPLDVGHNSGLNESELEATKEQLIDQDA